MKFQFLMLDIIVEVIECGVLSLMDIIMHQCTLFYPGFVLVCFREDLEMGSLLLVALLKAFSCLIWFMFCNVV